MDRRTIPPLAVIWRARWAIGRRLVRRVWHRKANALSLRYRYRAHPHLGCSQGGEDGILREIFRRLGVERGWFVEFGAWDGILHSNTYALVQRGWSGVGIECDRIKFRELERNMAGVPGYIGMCERVACTGSRRLDEILARTPVPPDFHLLSIDIDSNDYWVWESLKNYRPQVVVIEYNSYFSAAQSKAVRFVEDLVVDCSIYCDCGASAAALEKLGRKKGALLTPISLI